MSNGLPFVPDTAQTAVAIAYRNKHLIADAVCPRAPVGKKEFKYVEFTKSERFTVPQTLVGRKSVPGQVEFTSAERTASVEDHGLSDVIPNDDMTNAPKGYNPRHHAVEGLTDLVLLAREARVAKLYNTAGNFGEVVKLGTGGLKHLDDPDLDILPWLLELLNTPLMRPNAMTLNQRVATALRTNKRMIKAYNGSLGDEGLVPWQFIKDTLELEHINVGQARINTAKKGQAMSLTPAWKDGLALTYIDPLASFQNNRMSFALSAQYGDRVSGSREVAAGLRGGVEVQVGESVKELALAKDCGLLVTDVFTP